MADKALTDLPDGGAATSGDVIYVVRSGNSRKAAFPALADVATSGDYYDLDNTPTLGSAAALDVGTTAGTVAAGNHTHAGATTSAAGFMSETDKQKLDGIEAGADVTDATSVAAAGAIMDEDFSSNGLMTRTGAGTYSVTAIGTGAGTVAAGDDSRITGAVQKAGTGQVLTGQYGHTPHNYGNLSSGNITLNPANGMTGIITRNNTSNAIVAPAGTPTTVYNMIIFIDGTSSSGSPSLSGFDNSDFGDDMPGNNQHAWLYVTVGPSAKTAKIEAIDY